ncbi:MAG: M48 family metallopeptidase [Candidatus Doudnabacteria bacterium]
MDKNQTIPYQVKVSRRTRRLRLSVACDSTVTLTLPFGTAIGIADKFVQTKLAWIKRAIEYFKAHPGMVRARPVRGEYKKFKKQAIILAQAKVKQWAEFYGVGYGRIAIRNQKTRWGSCSKKGNLNFNYRIVQLRPELLDYLIVHELCHLQEFNHSRNFWALVAKAVPDYKKLRAELKRFRY